jgi:hypothetical protein
LKCLCPRSSEFPGCQAIGKNFELRTFGNEIVGEKPPIIDNVLQESVGILLKGENFSVPTPTIKSEYLDHYKLIQTVNLFSVLKEEIRTNWLKTLKNDKDARHLYIKFFISENYII